MDVKTGDGLRSARPTVSPDHNSSSVEPGIAVYEIMQVLQDVESGGLAGIERCPDFRIDFGPGPAHVALEVAAQRREGLVEPFLAGLPGFSRVDVGVIGDPAGVKREGGLVVAQPRAMAWAFDDDLGHVRAHN